MARVFLSHSSRDNAAASRMKAWLEQQGFEAPFLDFDKHSGIPPGADWERTLYREIDRSQALLILRSANWSASKWCFAEFTQARALGKPIFQVIESADGDPGPTIAPDLQVLDLRRERAAGLEQLRKQLETLALTARGGFAWDGSRPPYPGLLAFEEDDAPIYFGREDDIRRLIERLTARRTLGAVRLLVLLGASGSGKSSLLRAGVLPRLRRSGRGWWIVPPFRPQSQPCQELARALALAAGRPADWRDWHNALLKGDRGGTLAAVLAEIAADLRMAAAANEAHILLSIDQGEELFGGQEAEEVRRFFRILSAAMADDLPFLAVMTLRSDFLGRLQAAQSQGLTARFEEVSLAPLPKAQIPAIIQGPARVAGLEVEEAFVRQAVADAETEDALPLLAFALRELVERFGADRQLSLAAYQALGDPQAGLSPLENAVRRRADAVLAARQPSEEEKKALREAFVPAMVRFEQGNYVRRPARWETLPALAQPLLEQLVQARLLISREKEGERLLEVAHEALLRKWPLLRGWLDADREFLIGSQQLEQDLLDLQKAPESERASALLTGLKLQRAKAWLKERPQQLSAALQEFVRASGDQAEAQQRQARRTRRLVMGGLSGLTVLALTGGAIAWWREREARAAQAEQYEANHRALLSSNPLESVVNGLAAEETLRSNPGSALQLSSTLEQAARNNSERFAFLTGQGLVRSLVALPNGELASGGMDGTVKRWSQDGQQIGSTVNTNQGAVFEMVALPDGELITAGAIDSLNRWGKNGQQIGGTTYPSQRAVTSLAVLPGGEVLSGGYDGSIKRWGKDGRQIGATISTGHGWVTVLTPLPNGELISGGQNGTLKRWGKDGRQIGTTISTGHGWVTVLTPLPNGELISGGQNGTLKRWSKDGRQIGATISTGQRKMSALVLLANGDLLSTGQDGTLKRWGKDGRQIGVTIPTGQGDVFSLVALPNRDVFTAGADGSVKRWRTGDLDMGSIITTGQGPVTSLVALPSGTLLSVGENGTLKRWGTDGRQIGATLSMRQQGVASVVMLPNGELISGVQDGTLKRWSKDGQQIGAAISTGHVSLSTLVTLPNGELISGGHDGTLKRWGKDGRQIGSPIDLALVRGLFTRENLISLVALANGEFLSGGEEGSLKRWSKEGREIGTTIDTAQRGVTSLVQLPSGEILSGGQDGTLKRWSKEGRQIGTIIDTAQRGVTSLVVMPNGEIYSGGQDGTIKRWAVETVAKRACLDLRNHPVLRTPQMPPQKAARKTCWRLGALKE